MVAADGASQAGRDADGHERRCGIEHSHDDRDEDAERAPAGAGCEGKAECHQEDDGGQHHVEAFGRAGECVMHEDVGTKGGSRKLQCQGEGQDQHGRNHGLEAGDEALGGFLEGNDTADEQVDERENQRDDRTPRQADGGVGVAERGGQVADAFRLGIPEAAHVEHADDAANDEQDDGEQQVEQRGVGLLDGVFVAQRAQIARAVRFNLGFGHRTVIEAHDAEDDEERDGQQRVEVERDSLDEQLDARDALEAVSG